MDVILIGLSNIVSRRVLPALQSIPEVDGIDLATRKASDSAVGKSWTHGEVYEDYLDALIKTHATLAYVSVVNSEHERWVEAALRNGLHVIVDKPAVLGYDRAIRLVELAAKVDRCLTEATVFAYHPQIPMTNRIFAEAGCRPTRVAMVLSFPPFAADNFRYRRELGGGALWDLAPYVAACGRIFFESEPSVVRGSVISSSESVETAFSAIATYDGERGLISLCGFDTAYSNNLRVLGPSISVELDRAFTTPSDYSNRLTVHRGQESDRIEVPKADSFALFIKEVIDRIERHDWKQLTSDLLADARTVDGLRTAAVAP